MPGHQKPRFEYDKLAECGNLANWLTAEKEVRETLEFEAYDAMYGASQVVDLHVPSYHKGAEFSLDVRRSNGRLYLNCFTRWGRANKEFYVIGASHFHKVDPEYPDDCCKSKIVANHAYEKRRAYTCLKEWGRITLGPAAATDAREFFEWAARRLRVKLPENPLTEKSREQSTLNRRGARK